MPRIRIRTEANFKKRERLVYVLDFLRQHPAAPNGIQFLIQQDGVGEAEIEIFYQSASPALLPQKAIFIPSYQQFFSNKPTRQQAIEPISFYHKAKKISGIQLSSRWASLPETVSHLSFDIFETIFFHLSRWEEWHNVAEQLDEHGRFRANEAFLVKHDLHRTPVVDYLVWYFYDKLGLSPKLPATTFCRTHDLDILEKFPSYWKLVKAAASLLFYQKNLSGLRRLLHQYWKVKWRNNSDPYNTFDWLLKTGGEEKILFILAGGDQKGLEGHFQLDDPKLLVVLKTAINRGYQIGIHPSYDAAFDGQKLQQEKQQLEQLTGQKIQHSRQHFLRWRFPDTPRIIEEAGIYSDSTLGFSDRIGFRCGTGFDFQLYDFERERPFNFIERPLVVMDVALLREAGMNWFASDLNPGVIVEAERLLGQFLQENAHLTKVTFNLHNSTFDSVYLDVEGLKILFDKFF